ncbi:MAG: methyltransferase domain-containing protein [Candidatus Aenigmatarchaeota archaeon]
MKGHVASLWKRTKPGIQTDFLVREHIPKWLGKVKGKHILEAGCGEGYIVRKLTKLGADVDAFDNDPKMIRLAKRSERGCKKKANYKIGKLKDVNKMYPESAFDVTILSGVICFLNEHELSDVLRKIYSVTKLGGKLLIATNHTTSYFKKAKSKWIEYLTEPNTKLGTQKSVIYFNNSKGEHIYSGEIYFHTLKNITELLEAAGFLKIKFYEPLATKEDMKHYSKMWVDEGKIPFHLAVIAQK